MSGPTHMLTGLYLTTAIPNPAVSLPAAFASHFVLDMVPHNDYLYFYLGKKWELVFTSPLGRLTVFAGFLLSLFFALRGETPLLLLTGAVLGTGPDSLTALTTLLGYRNNPFNRFHRRLHTKTDLGEVFYNKLKGEQIEHTEELPQWRENFYELKESWWAKIGWLLETMFELVFLSVIIYNLIFLT